MSNLRSVANLVTNKPPTKQQMFVLEAFRDYRGYHWDEHNCSAEISQPELTDDGVFFRFEGMGLLSNGLLELVKFLKFLETEKPKYDPTKCVVSLRMNGKLFPALAGDDEEICKATVERVNDEAAAAYRTTPEYAEAQRQKVIREKNAAENFAQVLRDLRPDFSYLDMGRWLCRYIPAQDAVGSGIDIDEMYQRFENMGYIRNEGVFDPVVTPVGIEARVRYIVGQVMSFHRPEDPNSGFGPCCAHPRLGDFAEEAVRDHLASAIEN